MRRPAFLLISAAVGLAACGRPADYGITGPGLAGVVTTPANDPQSLNPLNLPTDAGFTGGRQGFMPATGSGLPIGDPGLAPGLGDNRPAGIGGTLGTVGRR